MSDAELISASVSPIPRCLCGAFAVPCQWRCVECLTPENIGTDDAVSPA